MISEIAVPTLALSVRQPWAWAIVRSSKNIENRSGAAIRYLRRRGLIAIHASKTMTRDEYEHARDFMASIGVTAPPPSELERGGIVGMAEAVDVVKASDSPWFFGPFGIVLANRRAVPFVPAAGSLGYFAWISADASTVPAPARWMLPGQDKTSEPGTQDLFTARP